MDTANKQNLPRVHWRFPESTKYGRVIPKEKLYSQSGVNADLKKQFVEQVSQIKWAYKIAESTINLAKTGQVQELEVIQIRLKKQNLDEAILSAIDKAIPHQTLFILTRDAKQHDGHIHTEEDQNSLSSKLKHADKVSHHDICYQAAHKVKTSTQTNKEKWQQSAYLQSQWLTLNKKYLISTDASPLPIATSLEGLYQKLLEALMPVSLAGENQIREPDSVFVQPQSDMSSRAAQQVAAKTKKLSIEERLARLASMEALSREIKQTKIKRDKEKQFNRKRELNDQLKALKMRLTMLQSSNDECS